MRYFHSLAPRQIQFSHLREKNKIKFKEDEIHAITLQVFNPEDMKEKRVVFQESGK